MTTTPLSEGELHVELISCEVLGSTGFGLNSLGLRFIYTESGTFPQKITYEDLDPLVSEVIQLDSVEVRRWAMASRILKSMLSLLNAKYFENAELRTLDKINNFIK